jgi:hypothetical protein
MGLDTKIKSLDLLVFKLYPIYGYSIMAAGSHIGFMDEGSFETSS